MKNFLSVIVTSYNYEQYIAQTLQTLVDRTCSDFEVVVVDDGSKDNSVSVIRQFATKCPYIRLFQHPEGENRGLSASILLALEHCKGNFVAFCESDDYWNQNHVKSLYNFMETHQDAKVLFNRISCINLSNNSQYDTYVESSNQFLQQHTGMNIFKFLTQNQMPTFSSACIAKDILQGCDFNSLYSPYLDFWLWRQICLTNPVFFVPDCVTYWRKHNISYDMTAHVQDIRPFLIASNDLLIKQYCRCIPWKLKLCRFWTKKSRLIQQQIGYLLKGIP